MYGGLFYLPSSLPDTPAQGADRFRTIVAQARASMCRFADQVALQVSVVLR